MEKLEIPTNKPKKEFKKHLNIDNNHRIIFSGVFGIGKTKFLKTYFEDKNKEYNSIFISPVNYSIAKNEDVFEYIKYDILTQLLVFKEIEIQSIETSKLFTLPFYFLKRPQDFIAPLLNLLPEVGDKFYAVYEKMMELYKNYEEYHEKLNETEFKQLKSIGEVMSNKIGSPYEENIYTKLITTFLERLKSSKEGTKNILIIDDIDRIDPDHIFRLFNVFATHFDHYSNDNKFGFDQIVFVCDVENIRNIFKNRYGTDVDFSGYIDKFYSYDIFYFENSKAVIEWYLSNLKILKVKSQRYEMADSDSIKETIKRELRSSGILLEYLIKYGGLNLRKLLRFLTVGYQYEPQDYRIMEKTILDWRIPILTVVDFLIKLFGGNINDLIKSVELCNARLKNVDDKELYKLLGLMLPILDLKNNKLQVQSTNISFKPRVFGKGNEHQYDVVYDLEVTPDHREIIFAKINGYTISRGSQVAGNIDRLNLNMIEMFLDCLMEIRSIHNQGETES